MNINRMTRDEIKVLFALSVIHSLIQKGMISGPDEITQNGLDCVELLKKRGLAPTDDEVIGTLHGLMTQSR